MLRPGPRPRGGSPRGLRPCSDRDPPGFCVKNAVFPRAEPACGPLRPAAPRAAPALCGRPPCHLRAFATPALPAAPLGCPSVTATTLPPFIDSATTRTISSDKTKNAHVCAQNATLTPMLPSSQRTLGYFRGGVWLLCAYCAQVCTHVAYVCGFRDADGVTSCGSRDLSAPSPWRDHPAGQSSSQPHACQLAQTGRMCGSVLLVLNPERGPVP